MAATDRTPTTANAPVLDDFGYEAWLGYGDLAITAR